MTSSETRPNLERAHALIERFRAPVVRQDIVDAERAVTKAGGRDAAGDSASKIISQAAVSLRESVQATVGYAGNGAVLDGELEVHHTAADGAKTSARLKLNYGKPTK